MTAVPARNDMSQTPWQEGRRIAVALLQAVEKVESAK